MPNAAPQTFNIVLLPGDGVGPEVTRAARDVLSVIGDFYGHHFSFTEHLIGGAAIVIGTPHGIRAQRKGGEKA